MCIRDSFEAEGTTAEDMFEVVVKVDDQVYGIPAEMKYNNLVLINKDMLDAAGLPVPDLNWTWDDYRDYAIQLTQGSGADAIYGSFFRSGANVFGINAAKQGNPYFYDDGTLTFEDPIWSRFLEFRYNLENTDKASTPQTDIKALNLNYRDQFFSGKVAMMPLGTDVYKRQPLIPSPSWQRDICDFPDRYCIFCSSGIPGPRSWQGCRK